MFEPVLAAKQNEAVALDIETERVEAIITGDSPAHDPEISSSLENKSMALTATLEKTDVIVIKRMADMLDDLVNNVLIGGHFGKD